ncbi:50S ribosomal protein L3 [Candidatus Scalindua japonica]|uniref:Large ribosomal subunit protein uL3 n=1 Tax=Candidatus Scalindua japonica TaxID=1284222 RepID=A0A286U293_9BACT|nr:50S ribosomal protein L3 [Candidatus Scalindua japonica]GAX62258.1 50S ribosomal protein L3 [Candidatus Scalindua japonica]
MIAGLLGKKLGMTQIFSKEGGLIPVTLLQAGPCDLLQIKTNENDGYSALQLGFDERKKKRSSKAEIGHCSKVKTGVKRLIREFRTDTIGEEYKQGQALTVAVFDDVKSIDVTGTSKGKGFAGAMKRWGFRGGPATHGCTTPRSAGSVGAGTSPGHVHKGKKMAGRMGGKRITVKNLNVIKVDTDRNLLVVKGAVPGPNGGYIIIRKSRSEL